MAVEIVEAVAVPAIGTLLARRLPVMEVFVATGLADVERAAG